MSQYVAYKLEFVRLGNPELWVAHHYQVMMEYTLESKLIVAVFDSLDKAREFCRYEGGSNIIFLETNTENPQPMLSLKGARKLIEKGLPVTKYNRKSDYKEKNHDN